MAGFHFQISQRNPLRPQLQFPCPKKKIKDQIIHWWWSAGYQHKSRHLFTLKHNGKPCFVPIVGFLSFNILAQNLFDLLLLRHTNFLFCAALVFYLAESPYEIFRSYRAATLWRSLRRAPTQLWSCWASSSVELLSSRCRSWCRTRGTRRAAHGTGHRAQPPNTAYLVLPSELSSI